jgi:hypothetical protein
MHNFLCKIQEGLITLFFLNTMESGAIKMGRAYYEIGKTYLKEDRVEQARRMGELARLMERKQGKNKQ